MSQTNLRLYYKNVTSEAIGDRHGITKEQFKSLAQKTSPLIKSINEQRQSGKTPYRALPYDERIALSVKSLTEQLQGRFENFVVLGIGGSALGNIALQTALNPYMYNLDESQRTGPRLFVFDNVDPVQLASFIDWISYKDDKLDKTVFNVVSKSGRTSETAAQYLLIRQILLERLGPDSLREHVVATTDPKEGTLRAIADELKLRCLEVPDGVGGRFSVLSAVGLFSAAMCGIDIDELLEGARSMDTRVSYEDFYENPAAIYAAINYHYYYQDKKMSVLMPYCYALKDMADWFRQLWAESLGKKDDLSGNEVFVGPTPVKALGTTDQHSQVQLYRDGPNDKLFTFLQVNKFQNDLKIGPAPDCAPELKFLAGKQMSQLLNSEKSATEYALLERERPCLSIIFDEVNAYSIGQFIYLFEVATSIAGALFNINTYDQPAVELGKEVTFALMGKSGYKELSDKINPLIQIDERFLI